jgi:tyrosyl-tRNA synthetase
MQKDFIFEIKKRGYFNNCTNIDSLTNLMEAGEPITAYIGFDCTARSLHVGSLSQIMLLRLLQKHGHKPIILMGGGTTKIGDPSGKDEARKIISAQDIAENKASMAKVFSKFIQFGEGRTDAIMVDNAEWLDEIKYLEFLQNYGRHFSINRMLTFDSVKLRLEREQNLSFLEFNYMLLQAYDFVELYKRYGCRLQLGGSDQWGNIVNGTDLGRRMGTPELFGLTTNLITTSAGTKMGKTAQGAVWLNEDMLSPYDYWQFWRNTDDQDVIRFLKMFTELDSNQIENYAKLQGQELNEAKIVLANAATAMCHGKEAAMAAEKTAVEAFVLGKNSEGLPEVKASPEELIFKIMVTGGMAESGGAAKRLIKANAVKIDDQPVTNEMACLQDVTNNDEVKISVGKKKHYLIKIK